MSGASANSGEYDFLPSSLSHLLEEPATMCNTQFPRVTRRSDEKDE